MILLAHIFYLHRGSRQEYISDVKITFVTINGKNSLKRYRSTVIVFMATYYEAKIVPTFANSTVSRKARSALTHVAALLINALSIRRAHVITGRAFVHIHANRIFLIVQILIPAHIEHRHQLIIN